MPGFRDVEAIKGEKGMKKSSLRKEVRREGIFLPLNETIFILFMSESIYPNESVTITHLKNGFEEGKWLKR